MNAHALKNRQTGQAIIYIIAMLPAIFFSVLVIYNTATVTREKMSLQNTADAVTYSSSVVVARNLNFLSYTNRAMAANESGIAMVASMQTTAAMLVSTASNLFEAQALIHAASAALNLARAFAPPSPATPIFLAKYAADTIKAQKAHSRAKSVMRTQKGLALPFRGVVDLLRVLNYGIAASQTAMYTATLPAIWTTAKDVRDQNDVDAEFPAADTLIGAAAFTAQYGTYLRPYHQKFGPGGTRAKFAEALRFAHTAQAMRDDFTKERRILPGFLSSANFIGKIVKFLSGALIDWEGGTELVSETSNAPGAKYGRIRWQSADAIYVKAPINLLLGDVLPIYTRDTDYKDLTGLRFGIGAGAAAQGGAYTWRSWEGERLNLPAIGPQARTYGGLNSKDGADTYGTMEKAAFDRAANSADRSLLYTAPAAKLAFLLDAKWRYGPRQDIGLLTSDWYMPPFYDIRTHPQMKEDESDSWLGQQAIQGKNPLKWGSKTNRGPVLALTMEKKKTKVNTGEQAKFGRADGSLGLKDKMANDSIKVLSSAQVYFRRPQDRWQRRDLGKADVAKINGVAVGFTGGYIEHRSLFSPYWHVHNVQPSTWSRLLANGTALIGTPGESDWDASEAGSEQ